MSKHDRLVMENGTLTITTAEGKTLRVPESRLYELVREEVQPPIDGAALPDGVKFCRWQPPFLCVVHQQSPHVRQVRWITHDSPAPFGEGAKLAKREISIPYAITFAMFCRMGSGLSLFGYDELYFRNKPLTDKTDTLGYPALLNISRIDIGSRQRSWICTQYLGLNREEMNWSAQLGKLIDHTWNGGFNLSSEHHEGASWYGESQGIHADLHPIEKWVEATRKDKAFALSVNWKRVPMNVDQLISAMLEECQQRTRTGRSRKRPPASGLIGRLLNHLQQASPRQDA